MAPPAPPSEPSLSTPLLSASPPSAAAAAAPSSSSSSSSSPPDYLSECGFIGYLLFSFALPLLRLGNSRLLHPRDLPPPPPSSRSLSLLSRFLAAWDAQKKSGTPSILSALWLCFWKDILWTAFLALVKGLGTLSGPVFLFFLVDYASGNVRFQHQGVVLIASLLVVKVCENLAQRHWYFGMRILGCKVQAVVMAAVYQKELCLSSSARREHTAGEIVNYVSVDAYRLCEFSWRLHWSWLVPFVILAALAFGFSIVGLAVIPALVLIVAAILCLYPLMKSMQQSQRKFMATQDERLRSTSEVLMGMKVIKLQAWEEKFNDFIQQKRDVEFRWLSETLYKRNVTLIINWLLPIVLTCSVLVACVLLGITLTSTIVFTVVATFRIIQDPIRMTPEVISSSIQAQVSVARLEKFLLEEELPMEALVAVESSAVSEYAVRVNGAVLSWNPKVPKPSLNDLNLVVRRGEKVAVCGAVGSGKSTLLLSLLGEVPKLAGTVHLSGRVAYVPQTAWIQTMTVRDNILFGKEFDLIRYRKTLRACALEEDVKTFSHGDLTEIGERGINMSGGQKQRIQLARAVYNDADIYLLDDPFSAVDAQTASVLFHECVMGALKDKTVVLVTHQIEFLPSVDTILVMKDGEIKQAGTYDDLLMAGEAFEQLVSAHQEALHTVIDENGKSERGGGGALRAGSENGPEQQLAKIQKRLSREESLTEKGSESGTQLVQEESMESGKVGVKPYLHYTQIARGEALAIAMVIGQLLFSVSQLYANLWLAKGVSDADISSPLLIGVYACLCLVCVIFFSLRSLVLVKLGLQASKNFFSRFMTRVMKAPMSFFDSTPSGRILNRASVDMSVIDLDIPLAMTSVLGTGFDVVCIIVVTAIVTWEILLLIIPVLLLAQYLQRYYAAAARELNRINSTTKAPIVSNSAETLSGCAIIRAFKEVERFRTRNLQLIDRDASAYIYKFAALEWMVVRIELSSITVLIVSAALVLYQSNVSSGFAGLAVTYALALNSSLVVFSIWQCFLGIYMVSVERIKQYLDLPADGPATIEGNRPSPEWPQKGKVVLDHLQIQYRENSPMVLKGITCTFSGGQRIGVVGRTGSGKTTLISAIFRLVEPCGGRICIDDVDICSIGLHDLRFKLGIIPQEPVLFQGTVRTNLDPLNQYTDYEVWEALRKCQLAEVIEKLPLRLESRVSDQGENWSAGQRQLFCLGRVLLKQSQVLVLDEATASIDSSTDALLQRVIREEFSTCTVITVAHRIPTVIDSDMVLALRDGVLMEFDSPRKLMEKETSLFALLVAEYWAQAGRNSSSTEKLLS